MTRRTVLLLLLALMLLALLGFPAVVDLLTDWYWFSALHYQTVFSTALTTKFALGLAAGIGTFLFMGLNLWLAQRGIAMAIVLGKRQSMAPVQLTVLIRRGAWGVVAFLALIMGLAASSGWLMVQRFLHATPFHAVDPVFGRDVGYYVFTLPLISAVLNVLLTLTILTLIMVAPLYVLRGDILVRGRRVTVEPSAEWHVAGLLALLFVVLGLSAFFVRLPSLLYSTTGPLFGASYTDLVISAPALRVVAVAAFVGAGLVLMGARSRRLTRNTAIAAALFFGISLLGAGLAAALQKFVVAPNELVRETPQLVSHIAATRKAWGLDSVTTRDLSGEATLTLADIQANRGTLRNVRLWDRGPLLQTFQALQEIRTYYDFRSVDDDRYTINDQYRQVLLSARELNTTSLPTRNFINDHLTYTHGMGLTLSPPNEISEEGLPDLFIKDLPPTSSVSVTVQRPQLYYSELNNDYVFVNTRQPEFDYPSGDSSAVTVYRGEGGVPAGSIFRRLLLSLRFGSFDILFTNLITPDSRVMYHRRILERARTALPFLVWDQDPYLVIRQDGRLVWLLDAYTATGRYPYAQPLDDGTNYLRNSVKVAIDAYDGTVKAYVIEPGDPLIQTYEKVFPGIFQPLDSMPADLKAHMRYPADLFRVQTALYSTYHMDAPKVFYAREDQWQIPRLTEDRGQANPFLRHMVMRLPGEAREEYISMTPFTPRGKDNLAAWMVARSDQPHYGQLAVYRFPRQSLIFGPVQIENRINQNTDISRQISLWDERGSQVIRGNLLVIPIGESLIFVQALYLQAEGGRIPELKRVIVAYQNQVVMAETLDEAITSLFGGSGAGGARPTVARVAAAAAAATASGAPSAQVAQLVREASNHYQQAIAAQRVGDWARYGDEMRMVGETLTQLQQLTSGSTGGRGGH